MIANGWRVSGGATSLPQTLPAFTLSRSPSPPVLVGIAANPIVQVIELKHGLVGLLVHSFGHC